MNSKYLKIITLVILLVLAGSWFTFSLIKLIWVPPAPSIEPIDEIEPIVGSWQSEIVAQDLDIPWDLLWLDNEIYFTERSGRLRVVRSNGQVETIAVLDEVYHFGEGGLLGMASHPDFASNRQLYLYFTYQSPNGVFNRVSRFNLSKTGELNNEIIVIDNIPAGQIHNGGRIAFGPDGYLWILTGDAGQPTLAQSPNSLAGKILRLADDGVIPEDNPWSGLPTYSIGHRNPQGLVWTPTGDLLATEHGSSAYDEINKIEAGKNYGWPVVQNCNSQDPKFKNPIFCSGVETWAPSGITSLSQDQLVFAGLRSQSLWLADLKTDEVSVLIDGFGRLRAVIKVPDGSLYLITSNQDGRGQPTSDDDKIIKLTLTKEYENN